MCKRPMCSNSHMCLQSIVLSIHTCDCGSLVVRVTNAWPDCPGATENPPMHIKSVEAQCLTQWSGVVVRRGVRAKVSSSSLERGLKLRDPLQKALVLLYIATLI
ncbi:hypothetical protein TNCV_370121 [Trichonephila clavipes]|nr:hypothetical protein TNCV_370121 [Trichonephila clavipes]